MQKINFQDLPNTTTPINATNLNAIQTNVETEFSSHIKLIHSANVGSGTTTTYSFPNANSIYMVIAHQNGSENYCIFDIVYGQGTYYTRIKDSNTGTLSVSYSSSSVRVSSTYSARIRIIELQNLSS